MAFTDDWNELTPDERYEKRMAAWLEPANVEFASDRAAADYRERVTLLRDAIELRKPARVPIAPWVGLFPAFWGGLTAREAYYDYPKLNVAWQKYHAEFKQDVLASSISIVPCRILDTLDYRLYDWPGHGVPDDASYQYNEKEWMKADEYDALLADPSSFWQRRYLPRIFGALEPAGMLAPYTDLVEIPFTGPYFIPYGLPPVQEMFQKLLDAGRLALDWVQAIGAMDGMATATYGVPAFVGGATKAPYDILGDTLRGTRGLMMDTFRRPQKVLDACEQLVPMAVDMAVRAADVNRNPVMFIPLHKGADGFLSDEGFRRFYWPSLKKVILGLIGQGIVPLCFAEGGYNERLEAIHDEEIPAGKMIWMFDDTDMREVRRRLGGFQCFGGNVPGALFVTGSASEVDAYVKQLLDDVAGPGGFILSSGIVIDQAKPECVKAMIEAGREHGGRI
jgi:hypothetical protein